MPFKQWRIRICLYGIMQLDAGGKAARKRAILRADQIAVIDEQRRAAGLGDERRRRSGRRSAARPRLARNPAGSVPSAFMRAPPSARAGRACRWVPLGSRRARRSRRLHEVRAARARTRRASALGTFAARPPRPARSPGPAARPARRAPPPRATAPLASAASSISVGLTRLPLILIIASSRPRKRSRPSSPRTARSPDQTAMPP